MKLSKKAMSINESLTLAISSKAKEMKSNGIDIISFGAGEPDFDTPRNIKQAAIKAINDGFTKYTATSGVLELKQAICNKYKRDFNLEYDVSQVVVSNGAKHSLLNAFMSILNPDDEVIIPSPYWISYTEMIRLADGVPVIVKTQESNKFKITPKLLADSITDKTRAIVLNSPSNPTGMVYTMEELENICKVIEDRDIYIVSDEIYEKLVYDGVECNSIAQVSDSVKNKSIIVNGVSKTYSMTGWRIGYTLSDRKIAKIMSDIQSHATSNPNSIAQIAAIEALNGSQECVEDMKKQFVLRRNYMVDKINNMNKVSCEKPQGAFYVMMNICKICNKEYNGIIINDSTTFAEVLLKEAKVAVIPGVAFGEDDFVRLSYATSMENIEIGLKRIENFMRLI